MKLKAMLISSVLTTLAACGGGSGSSTTATDTCSDLSNDSFDCQTMLQDIKTVAVTKVTELESALSSLSAEVDLYCADTSGSATAAQDEFKNTMAVVQQLEVMQFGPIASVRDDFYVWPSNNLCRIDEQIATAANIEVSNIDPGRRSLTAVEYLLFEEDVATQCKALTVVDTWVTDTPSLSDRKDARCTYAKRIVDDLETKVATLKTDLNNYDFATAFTALQQGANAISDGLFYIDTQTKDAKIKEPLIDNASINNDAAFNTAQLESQFAHISKENIKNNLIGAKAIIEAGLDDYLAVKGQQTLATDMVAAINGALANIAVIDDSLNAALAPSAITVSQCTNLGTSGSYDANSSDLEALCALQWNIKTFTDLLKNDFVLALSFSTPATADGDND